MVTILKQTYIHYMYLTQHHVVPFVVLNVVWIFKENVTVASSWGRIFMLILKQKEKLKKKKKEIWSLDSN